ncbi:hypothetical protein [Weissella cibaria]|uniref:hypothetical protein n=1 Tax=Weissella cibaria TaxID=137591 RepID=UPI000D0AD557|nr:hypothetical protein [Weissella cibaria]AVO65841.1 hypothetical protein C6N67_01915 [Weissella cibaria]MCT0957443.1 hypothetical protein [Weissella cibaria]NKN30834.1 hypothetical protein [Weissella cibaria]NKN79720.1 hypothetical protein [Weissella cibaria]NKN97870.1 hypothetical protein [Weissella cibaria]
MAKIIQVEGLSEEVIQILNGEAEKNGLSRNALLVLVIETFAKNVQAVDATEILALPLQDVTQQLNQLTFAISNSNHNISNDFNALKDAVQKNSLIVAEQTQMFKTLLNNIRR